MSDKVSLDFKEITQRLKRLELPDVDLVVGIGSGGIVPASLAAYKLDRPLVVFHINYRDSENTPLYPSPQLLAPVELNDVRRVLLVDDVSVSGKTMDFARGLLGEREVYTLVLKGQADYVLFPEVGACVNWPWKADNPAP